MSDSSNNAASWSFVLANRGLISKLAYKFKGSIDFDDFHAQCVLDLGMHGHRFDESKGSASTFIVWRMRAVRTEMLRRDDKFSMRNGMCDTEVDSIISTSSSPGRIEKMILVSQILDGATERQKEAATSLMLGLTGVEIREQMGCGITARNARLYRLAENII